MTRTGPPRSAAALLGTLLVTASCSAPPEGPSPPCPDLALRLFIEGHNRPDDPLGYRSQYILEPDRKLRVALGQGATAAYFPRLTRRLGPAEMDAVRDEVFERHLMSEPTSPDAEARQRGPSAEAVAVYHVAITCGGHTHAYATTAEESPATAALVRRLVELRRRVLPVPEPSRSPEPRP